MATVGLHEADRRGIDLVTDNGDGTGTINVSATAGSTPSATTDDVAASDTNVTLLALNASRKSASIFNDSDKALYVKFGTTASTTSFKVKILAGGYFEFPQPIYTGKVDGIWEASPTGNALTSEEV